MTFVHNKYLAISVVHKWSTQMTTLCQVDRKQQKMCLPKMVNENMPTLSILTFIYTIQTDMLSLELPK